MTLLAVCVLTAATRDVEAGWKYSPRCPIYCSQLEVRGNEIAQKTNCGINCTQFEVPGTALSGTLRRRIWPPMTVLGDDTWPALYDNVWPELYLWREGLWKNGKWHVYPAANWFCTCADECGLEVTSDLPCPPPPPPAPPPAPPPSSPSPPPPSKWCTRSHCPEPLDEQHSISYTLHLVVASFLVLVIVLCVSSRRKRLLRPGGELPVRPNPGEPKAAVAVPAASIAIPESAVTVAVAPAANHAQPSIGGPPPSYGVAVGVPVPPGGLAR